MKALKGIVLSSLAFLLFGCGSGGSAPNDAADPNIESPPQDETAQPSIPISSNPNFSDEEIIQAALEYDEFIQRVLTYRIFSRQVGIGMTWGDANIKPIYLFPNNFPEITENEIDVSESECPDAGDAIFRNFSIDGNYNLGVRSYNNCINGNFVSDGWHRSDVDIDRKSMLVQANDLVRTTKQFDSDLARTIWKVNGAISISFEPDDVDYTYLEFTSQFSESYEEFLPEYDFFSIHLFNWARSISAIPGELQMIINGSGTATLDEVIYNFNMSTEEPIGIIGEKHTGKFTLTLNTRFYTVTYAENGETKIDIDMDLDGVTEYTYHRFDSYKKFL